MVLVSVLACAPLPAESAAPDAVEQFLQLLKSGEIGSIRACLKEHPEVASAGFVVDGLNTNALCSAVDLVPKSESRIDVFRLLVESGSDPKFVQNRLSDPRVSYNAVSYPEKLSPGELEYLLDAGADPNQGVCMPQEPPLLRIVRMLAEGRGKLDRYKVVELVRALVKHGANPAKPAGIPVPIEIGGTKIVNPTAQTIADAIGFEDLKTALSKGASPQN